MIKRIIGKFWKRLTSIPASIGLGLLTFFVVTAVLPSIAAQPLDSKFSSLEFPLGSNSREQVQIFAAQGDAGISPNTQSINFLEEGRNLYDSGRFSEAAAVWEESVKNYENQGDGLNQAVSLNYLSIAYQELGQWEPAQTAITQSLNLLNGNKQRAKGHTQVLAQALNTQGSLLLATGQTEAALESWKQAEKAYTEIGDRVGILGSQINQAQALQTLGLYRRAQTTLERISQQLQAEPDSSIKITGLRSLGDTLQVVGDVGKSQEVLAQSLAIAQQLDSPTEISSTLLSLGNSYRALQQTDKAIESYQEATENAPNSLTKVEAQLNLLSLLLETKKWADAQSLLPQIESQLSNILPSRAGVYAQVNFAESLMKWDTGSGNPNPNNATSPILNAQQIAKTLAKAVEQAKMLGDSKAESYALGQLGHLYEGSTQWKEARSLTEQALVLAQASSADYIVARWQGQLGRILKQEGDTFGAISAYTEAVNTLQSLRSDLAAINPDIQFSFNESVEPVYRQLVSLLLQSNPSQQNLQKAREVIEALQVAELDNFFREACLDINRQQIDQLDPAAAVIYPIILPDRLEVILSLPGKPLSHYTTVLPQNEVETILGQFLESLNPFFANQDRLRLSQQVYSWLIEPTEKQLAQSEIKTLVFVLDGVLRNLPMAALSDGKQYLVEKYSVALAPGLQLLATQSLQKEKIKVLTAGLSEARQGFSALPGVQMEVQQISSEVPAKIFLNQEFTVANLQKQLTAKNYPVVHLATHGQFSSNSDETFILTWNEKIKVKEFESLLRSREQQENVPIELLILSACQTAAGDKRAALGLAGVAVRSGAGSTLATLWSVKDQSTAELMSEFYRKITQSGVSKAEALRQAQLSLLKNPGSEHPFYWAPFILVGNWR
ncbi:CHAT domain-containing protein [Microcoleus sp. FACHB-672]|uniref:CHAT domain-containing protein n=1 Tax=Microcoleus sp. FACHB-672 TaxID=2692825 RepID=UPI001684D1C5|nr:CHAT domain-containing protein [Microcoleus sp. FACHB-672]MBD2040844.1 CHAT domain-containing protein [Microcoleus sp. FACHB-672]